MKNLIVVVALGLGTACDRADVPVPVPVSSAPHVVDPRAAGAPDSRRLCMTAGPGATPIDHALRAGSRAAAKTPDAVDVWLELGRTWVQKARISADPGFYLNAGACATTVLELSPENTVALNLRAMAQLNDHRFREARATAERVLARDADDPVAWGTVSDAALELGDVEAAERAVQRMLDLKPDLASYSRAAYLRWLRGDRAGAKLVSEQAIAAGRNNRDPEPAAWVLVQTALLFWHEGDYAGADAGFDLALDRVVDYPPALVGKARVAMAGRRYAEAAVYLRTALDRSPSVESAWLLGDALLLMGDAKGAEAAFERAVAEGRSGDKRSLAQFYASKNRDLEEAVKLARAEHHERPGSQTKDVLAWALYRAGSFAEARELSERAIAIGTVDARMLFHAGAIRIASGEAASGKELIRRALKTNPEFDVFEAKEARRLVASGA